MPGKSRQTDAEQRIPFSLVRRCLGDAATERLGYRPLQIVDAGTTSAPEEAPSC